MELVLLLSAAMLGANEVGAVNVVVFLPGTNKFERQPLEFVTQNIALRNHRVCTFKGIIVPETRYLVKQQLVKVRAIQLDTQMAKSVYEPLLEAGNQHPWTDAYDTVDDDMDRPRWAAYNRSCLEILNSDVMHKLTSEVYDVALVYHENPCHLAIVHALAIPFILYDLSGLSDEILAASSPSALSLVEQALTVPSSRTSHGQPMSSSQLMNNLWQLVKEASGRRLLARFEAMDEPISRMFREDYELKKRFVHGSFPNVNEIKRRAELFFVNSDPLLEFNGRRTPANLVYVGGAHIDRPKPLFEPWNSTNAAAKEGVILCQLGIRANASAMPDRMREALIKAFARLPDARIYWQIGTWQRPLLNTTITSTVPTNVNRTSYLPQNDLLASKYTKLLISNGGMMSIMEALAYGVPVLGIPLTVNNYHNLRKVEAKGFGIILPKHQLTADTLHANKFRYKLAAKSLSRAYNSRPVNAFHTLHYWVEYVARHHGAKYVKTNRRLDDEQFVSLLALLAAVLFAISAAIFLPYVLLKFGLSRWKCWYSRGHGDTSETGKGDKEEVLEEEKQKKERKAAKKRKDE